MHGDVHAWFYDKNLDVKDAAMTFFCFFGQQIQINDSCVCCNQERSTCLVLASRRLAIECCDQEEKKTTRMLVPRTAASVRALVKPGEFLRGNPSDYMQRSITRTATVTHRS